MNQSAAYKYYQVLVYMVVIYGYTDKLDRTKVPQAAIDRYKALVMEEIEWIREAVLVQKVDDPIVYQEELMYTVNELLNIANTYKIDLMYVRSQAHS
jgi:hypothetical protein